MSELFKIVFQLQEFRAYEMAVEICLVKIKIVFYSIFLLLVEILKLICNAGWYKVSNVKMALSASLRTQTFEILEKNKLSIIVCV